jgi:hypothetical protein
MQTVGREMVREILRRESKKSRVGLLGTRSKADTLSIARQLPLSPMCIFAIGVMA